VDLKPTAADPGVHRWRILASAMLTFFAIGVTFFAVPPLIGVLRASFALSNLELGFLMGAIAAPAIVFSVPLGAALDRWPPRAAGLGGLAAMLVGSAAFALAPSYGWLLAGRLLFGAGALLMNLLLARMISVAFAGRELALAMGLFTGVYAGSMIVLFSVHTWLERAFGWRAEMGVLTALVLAAIPLHAAVMPRRPPHAGSTAGPGKRFSLPAPLVALGIAWMLYFVPFSAIATFGPEWSGGGAAGLLITSVITWVALFGTPAAGALIDRTGRPTAWCIAGLGLLAGTLGLMAAGAVAAVAAMAAIGVVASAVPPAFYSLPGKLVPPERVGLAFGFITALSNLGTVVGPAVAGAVRDATPSWSVLWGVLAAAAVVGAATAALAWPPRAGREAGASVYPLHGLGAEDGPARRTR
jgi:predicted MFS family arabinose efflux permease